MFAAALVTIAVLNPAAVSQPVLHRAEQAIEQQANTSLQRAWNTPRVRFTADPAATITITFASNAHTAVACDEQVVGCHWVTNNYGIEVETDADPKTLTSNLDHEIIETLVDPDTTGREICDPVEYNTYERDGIELSDFVLPAYYDTLSFGHLDQMGTAVRHPTAYGHRMGAF